MKKKRRGKKRMKGNECNGFLFLCIRFFVCAYIFVVAVAVVSGKRRNSFFKRFVYTLRCIGWVQKRKSIYFISGFIVVYLCVCLWFHIIFVSFGIEGVTFNALFLF